MRHALVSDGCDTPSSGVIVRMAGKVTPPSFMTFTFMGWRAAESMLILLLLLGGCSSSSDPSGDAGRAGVRAPGQVDLQPMDLAGFRNLIARQRGKVVVVDVWATYCPPCMRDFHHLVTLHREANPQNVVCMSLNIDNQGLTSIDRLVPPVLKFLEKQKATFDNVLMTEDADHQKRACRRSADRRLD